MVTVLVGGETMRSDYRSLSIIGQILDLPFWIGNQPRNNKLEEWSLTWKTTG
jgi:hypothetical protein